MTFYEALDVGWVRGLADPIGDVDGIKIARFDETVDRREIDVVGIDKIWPLPDECGYCAIHGFANAGGLGSDDRMFPVRFVPNGNNIDPTFGRKRARPQLGLRLVRKTIAHAQRKSSKAR
jgi:hypothetical protein